MSKNLTLLAVHFICCFNLNILIQKDICNCFVSKRQTHKIVGCTFFATHELLVLLGSCVIFMRCKTEKIHLGLWPQLCQCVQGFACLRTGVFDRNMNIRRRNISIQHRYKKKQESRVYHAGFLQYTLNRFTNPFSAPESIE